MVHAKAGLTLFLTVSFFEEVFEGKQGFQEKELPYLLRSDDAATRCTFVCSYYSRAVFLPLESPLASTTAG